MVSDTVTYLQVLLFSQIFFHYIYIYYICVCLKHLFAEIIKIINLNILRTQPQDTACQAMIDKRCSWTKGKVLGGSSVLNTMLYIRGNKRDFDQWESFGNPGWSYEDVLPYFKKSEDQRNPYLAKNSKHHSIGKVL